MYVRALRRSARRRLADPADRPEWSCPAAPVRYTRAENVLDAETPGDVCG